MLTNQKPNKPGYYWWTDGHEKLQVLEVTNDDGYVYASGGEIGFNVELAGDEDLWEYIKPPKIPKRKNLTVDED